MEQCTHVSDNGGGGGDPIMKGLQNLTREIRRLKTELKQNLANFEDKLKKEFNALLSLTT